MEGGQGVPHLRRQRRAGRRDLLQALRQRLVQLGDVQVRRRRARGWRPYLQRLLRPGPPAAPGLRVRPDAQGRDGRRARGVYPRVEGLLWQGGHPAELVSVSTESLGLLILDPGSRRVLKCAQELQLQGRERGPRGRPGHILRKPGPCGHGTGLRLGRRRLLLDGEPQGGNDVPQGGIGRRLRRYSEYHQWGSRVSGLSRRLARRGHQAAYQQVGVVWVDVLQQRNSLGFG